MLGDHVCLKTLEGLQPVDGIVRAVKAIKADRLELDPEACDGAIGWLKACRQSPALIANASGSSMIEKRGVGGYLPAVCWKLLGEERIGWDALLLRAAVFCKL